MSGIVGTIGAKSGIIGETELDYEHGNFTLSHSVFNLSNNYSRYVKMGHLVYCTGYLKFGASATSSVVFTGLPFTSRGDAANNCGGSCTFDGVNLYGTHTIPRIQSDATAFSFYCCTDDGGWNDNISVATNDAIVWTLFYMTEK